MSKLLRFILTYRLLHVVYWTWSFFSMAHIIRQNEDVSPALSYQQAGLAIFFQMVCVYTTIYYLFPRFYLRQRYFLFVLFVLVSIVGTSFLDIVCDHFLILYTYGPDTKHYVSFFIGTLSESVDTAIATLVFLCVVMLQSYYRNDQAKKRLERERVETELNFLKAQVNPHFLFNALNSIYVLIEEDTRLAANTLLRFSELLRYQLYDCSGDITTLKNELSFIANYIDLEKLRNGREVQVSFVTNCSRGDTAIAPFLLMPFVENAFKHLSDHTDKTNYIDIIAAHTGNRFNFSICNTCDPVKTAATGTGGIGLQNVKRRLQLLYPGKHKLDITNHDSLYIVNLMIETDENKLRDN